MKTIHTVIEIYSIAVQVGQHGRKPKTYFRLQNSPVDVLSSFNTNQFIGSN